MTVALNVEVLFSHCYSNASVVCAWFAILIYLFSAFNTDSSPKPLVSNISTQFKFMLDLFLRINMLVC